MGNTKLLESVWNLVSLHFLMTSWALGFDVHCMGSMCTANNLWVVFLLLVFLQKCIAWLYFCLYILSSFLLLSHLKILVGKYRQGSLAGSESGCLLSEIVVAILSYSFVLQLASAESNVLRNCCSGVSELVLLTLL